MEHEIAMALRGAYWALHRKTDAGLEPYQVTAHQYVLMELLAQNGPSKQSELVRLASSDPNTIRAMVVTMCRQGLLRREKHPTDGRAWLVHMTEKSVSLLPEIRKSCQDIRERFARAFDQQQLIQFLDQLRTFTSSLDDSPAK